MPSVELLVAGQEDAAEAALTEEPLDAVAADLRRQGGGGSRRGGGDGLPLLLGNGPDRVHLVAHGGLGARSC